MSQTAVTTPPRLGRIREGTAVRRAEVDRVIIATLNRLEGSTGVHTHTRSLADGFRATGITCDVVTPFSGSRAWTPLFAVRPLLLNRLNLTWSTLWYRTWHSAALRANLRRAMRAGAVSHVIAQCPPSARVAMDVRQELGFRDCVTVTMVCHFNGSEADEYRNQGALSGPAYDRLKAQEQRVLEQVDRVIYVSSWARDLVEQQRGITTRSSCVVRNGIPEKSPSLPVPSRTELGIAHDDLVLMNVGTLEPRKDQISLLRLFAQIVAEQPAAKLVLVGEGPHRALIESTARELGIQSRLVLLGHRADVPALLNLADIYVHYASAENCPIALLEASRAALPWAAKAAAGVVELLPALGGVALSVDSPEESLRALRPLLQAAAYRREIGHESQERFAGRFTQSAMVAGYADALGLTADATRP